MDGQKLSYIILSARSPDLSIAKKLARPIKHCFHTKRSEMLTDVRQRFTHIFEIELSEKVFQAVFENYAAKFYDVKRTNEQITKH